MNSIPLAYQASLNANLIIYHILSLYATQIIADYYHLTAPNCPSYFLTPAVLVSILYYSLFKDNLNEKGCESLCG